MSKKRKPIEIIKNNKARLFEMKDLSTIKITDKIISQIVDTQNESYYDILVDKIASFMEENNISICFVLNKEELIDCLQEHNQLKQQLAEKQKTIDEINKEFVQAIHDWKTLCAEKDKEISALNNKITQMEEQDISFHNQLAIRELEKVKEGCFNQKALVDFGNVACFMVDIADILVIINNQIKELKELS